MERTTDCIYSYAYTVINLLLDLLRVVQRRDARDACDARGRSRVPARRPTELGLPLGRDGDHRGEDHDHLRARFGSPRVLPWAQGVFFMGIHTSAYYLGLKNNFWGPETRGCMITSMKGFGQVGCMTCAFLCEPDHGRHYHLKTPLEHYIMY